MKKMFLILAILNLGLIVSASEVYKYEDYNNIFSREIREKDLISNNSVTYQFDMVAPIFNVDVIGKTNELSIITIEILKNASNWTEPAQGSVYKYFNVWIEQPKRIEKIKFKYFVDNSWMNDSNISEDNIKSYEWNSTDKQWKSLETKIIDNEDNRVYFESIIDDSSYFSSYFAIVGNRELEYKKAEDDGDEDITDIDNVDLEIKQSPGFEHIVILFEAVIVISILALLYYKRKA